VLASGPYSATMSYQGPDPAYSGGQPGASYGPFGSQQPGAAPEYSPGPYDQPPSGPAYPQPTSGAGYNPYSQPVSGAGYTPPPVSPAGYPADPYAPPVSGSGYPPGPYMSTPPGQPAYPGYPPPPPPKSGVPGGLIAVLAALVVVVLLGVVGIVIVLNSGNDENDPPPNGNGDGTLVVTPADTSTVFPDTVHASSITFEKLENGTVACDAVGIAEITSILIEHGCQTVYIASYVDSGQEYALTIGAIDYGSNNVASEASSQVADVVEATQPNWYHYTIDFNSAFYFLIPEGAGINESTSVQLSMDPYGNYYLFTLAAYFDGAAATSLTNEAAWPLEVTIGRSLG